MLKSIIYKIPYFAMFFNMIMEDSCIFGHLTGWNAQSGSLTIRER